MPLQLAEAIAEEWRQQGDKPKLDKMPLTQLAFTAIDITQKQRSKIIDQVAGYAARHFLVTKQIVAGRTESGDVGGQDELHGESPS